MYTFTDYRKSAKVSLKYNFDVIYLHSFLRLSEYKLLVYVQRNQK